MLDIPEVLIITLTALTVAVWTHSWIVQRREDRANQAEEVDFQEDTVEELVG
jgi:hypothetical protein